VAAASQARHVAESGHTVAVAEAPMSALISVGRVIVVLTRLCVSRSLVRKREHVTPRRRAKAATPGPELELEPTMETTVRAV
jgi:hypothetical protein